MVSVPGSSGHSGFHCGSDKEMSRSKMSQESARRRKLQNIFYRKQLNAFLLEDHVMTVMRPKLIGERQGPVKPLPQVFDLMVAITSLMNKLEEAGIVAGAFDADVVFELSLTTVEESLKHLFKLLKPLVGATASLSSHSPTEDYPTSASPHTGFASAKASVSSDIGSDSSTKPMRMTLGPSGAAMLNTRKIKEEKPQVDACHDHTPDKEPGKPKAVNSMTRTPPDIGWDLRPGESRGYWKYNSPDKWFKQAKITGKINNSMATMLLDSGAEVSIVDTTFVHVYTTLGRTTIKATVAGYLVYFFDAWVGALAGQDVILGIDFMVPAGIRLDLADGMMCLADEVRIQLSGRRPPYGRSTHSLLLEDDVAIPVEPKLVAEEEITHQGDQANEEGEIHAEPEADLTLDAQITEPTLVEDAPAEEIPEEPRIEELEEPAETQEDSEGYFHDGGSLSAKDLDGQTVILPEIVNTTVKVKIEDVQAGDPNPDRTQRVRRVAPQYREKLSDFIKGLLAATIIAPSTSPWASPIVIIIKKNGVDIRLCIDYRLINSLTRLMVYPTLLINDLLEDLHQILWYCSLDMASGSWNAPQIYQRLLENALYGFLKIGNGEDQADVFISGGPEMGHGSSVLGRRSYIDDILVTANSWDNLCETVKGLLDACDRWNLSVSAGLEARPKDLESLCNLPFPQTLRAMQSSLSSLNYYSRFIDDFAVYAAILYELRGSKFDELRHRTKIVDHPVQTGAVDQAEIDEDRWTRAMVAFIMLKPEIVSTPILKHFDPDLPPVIVVYANKWAISAALMQEHDGVFWPVTFTSRILKTNELNYGMVKKEVLALLRILDVWHTMLVSQTIKWTLDIVRFAKGEDEVLGTLAANITPREEVDETMVAVAPKKQSQQVIIALTPTVELGEELTVTIITASSAYATQMTVNEAEYNGLILCLDLLANLDRGRLVICYDSNLVIRQMRGEIACKAPALQLLREKAMGKLSSWPQHEFMHVKREWNRSADQIFEDLITLNLKTKSEGNAVHMSVIADLKTYLTGDVADLTAKDALSCAKIADSYQVGDDGLLQYCPPSASIEDEDRDAVAKLEALVVAIAIHVDGETMCSVITSEVVNERLREAIRDRPDHHNDGLRPHNIKAGDQV
ncbi:reverse transcriptase [Phytophthora megakarya]|uniref:Reverse transcriptase n=1 Tax=Phytophthora megakarya TaxID=4795 RepID=A0A225WQA9_9STRA|nr:reverse transcriptase [Phytophthora megakarya]